MRDWSVNAVADAAAEHPRHPPIGPLFVVRMPLLTCGCGLTVCGLSLDRVAIEELAREFEIGVTMKAENAGSQIAINRSPYPLDVARCGQSAAMWVAHQASTLEVVKREREVQGVRAISPHRYTREVDATTGGFAVARGRIQFDSSGEIRGDAFTAIVGDTKIKARGGVAECTGSLPMCIRRGVVARLVVASGDVDLVTEQTARAGVICVTRAVKRSQHRSSVPSLLGADGLFETSFG